MPRVRKQKINTSSKPSSSSSASLPKKKQKTVDLGWKGKDDEHIDSSDEDEEEHDKKHSKKQKLQDRDNYESEEEEEEEEALDAKRIRLARQYLDQLEDGESDESSSDDQDSDAEDDNNVDHDRIGMKLQRERLKREGAWEQAVADKVASSIQSMQQSLPSSSEGTTGTSKMDEASKEWLDAGYVKLFRGHDLTPTCVALQSDGKTAISGSKDHSVLLWDIENEKRSFTLCPHWKQRTDGESVIERTKGEVLSVACSDDGKYAAVGRRDSTVSIFDIRAGKNNLVKTFTGHKGAVTCLAFRTQSLQLFSGSDDRCIRHYNLNEMMYLETLYGHQFGVTDIDCHRKERPISVGRDRTARAWKIPEDTHLIFRGGAKVSSADCISVIKDDWYLTGHDDGHLGLWMTEKKKAVTNIELAHGADGNVARGINSIGTLKGSDLAVTGSYDGYIRLWKAMTGLTLEERKLEPLSEIPLMGHVNGIVVGPKARFCVVSVGQEPRLGRWNRVAKAKNRFGIVMLRNDDDKEDETDVLDEAPATESESSDEGG